MAKRIPKGKSRHHRRPKSRSGTSCASNISIVDNKKHEAWHCLFENKKPHQIAMYINAVWLDRRFTFIVCERRDGDEDIHSDNE